MRRPLWCGGTVCVWVLGVGACVLLVEAIEVGAKAVGDNNTGFSVH